MTALLIAAAVYVTVALFVTYRLYGIAIIIFKELTATISRRTKRQFLYGALLDAVGWPYYFFMYGAKAFFNDLKR